MGSRVDEGNSIFPARALLVRTHLAMALISILLS